MTECPFCHAHVEPLRNDAGLLVCPLCANTGNAAAEPAEAQPLAKASLVVGIVAVCIPLLGFIPGIVAVALSHRFEQRCLHDPRLQGRSRATAGLVLGIVAMGVHGLWTVAALLR
ncbi:MAG: DUF4190 domain-containing protein [Thermoplasmatota archaeon]